VPAKGGHTFLAKWRAPGSEGNRNTDHLTFIVAYIDDNDDQEVPLDHSPRAMAFVNNEVFAMVYPPPDFAVLHIPTLKATPMELPPAPASSVVTGIGGRSMGAISGLFGAKEARPSIINVQEGEVLIRRDCKSGEFGGDWSVLIIIQDFGIFIGPDGKPTREVQLEWPGPPDEFGTSHLGIFEMYIEMSPAAFVKPYVYSILPPGTVPAPATNETSGSLIVATTIPSTVVQIRSSISTALLQTRSFPFSSDEPPLTANTTSVRLATPSPVAKSPLFVVSAPTERAALASEGSTLWCFFMKGWGEQVDELVETGAYEDALTLLNTLDTAILPDKVRLLACLQQNCLRDVLRRSV
jgi:Vam6/Vps39-like protein vacuolar protein sorting-associated protein 39